MSKVKGFRIFCFLVLLDFCFLELFGLFSFEEATRLIGLIFVIRQNRFQLFGSKVIFSRKRTSKKSQRLPTQGVSLGGAR